MKDHTTVKMLANDIYNIIDVCPTDEQHKQVVSRIAISMEDMLALREAVDEVRRRCAKAFSKNG